MVVVLRRVHPLGILVCDVPQQAQDRQDQHLQPEDRAAEEARHDAVVLWGHADHGRDGGVGRDEGDPEGHRTRYRYYVVLCPVVRDEPSLAQDGQQDSAVHGRTPYPMACDLAVALDLVPWPEKHAADVEDDGVVDSVGNPGHEHPQPEELIVLAEAV